MFLFHSTNFLIQFPSFSHSIILPSFYSTPILNFFNLILTYVFLDGELLWCPAAPALSRKATAQVSNILPWEVSALLNPVMLYYIVEALCSTLYIHWFFSISYSICFFFLFFLFCFFHLINILSSPLSLSFFCLLFFFQHRLSHNFIPLHVLFSYHSAPLISLLSRLLLLSLFSPTSLPAHPTSLFLSPLDTLHRLRQ
jgi:hypothetical protein